MEAQAVGKAREMMGRWAGCELVTWNLQKDVGMTCGGEMTLLFEAFGGEAGWHVVVFGAGHVSRAVVGLLATLSCRVDVVDEREEWLRGVTRRGNVVTHLVKRFEEGVSLVREDSFVLSITKGHSSGSPGVEGVVVEGECFAVCGGDWECGEEGCVDEGVEGGLGFGGAIGCVDLSVGVGDWE